MTETEKGWHRDPDQKPKQHLGDQYHPAVELVGVESPYVIARDLRDQKILASDPKAILPHYPCG